MVCHELKLIDETTLSDDTMTPLIASHDVDWTYRRRDVYYDPESIPRLTATRIATSLVPDTDAPVNGGVNGDLSNGHR
jgi:hypothetical protein